MKGITKEEEIKKNSELKQEDIQHIRNWLAKENHFPPNISDELLILILHSCYYRLEPCKVTIDNYFTMRTHLPEFFTQRDIDCERLSEAHKTTYYLPLKGRTKEGYRVLLCGINRTDPSLFHFADSVKLFTMVTDMWGHSDGTAPGFVLLLDMSGISLGHIPKLGLPTMKKVLLYLQDALPVRLKAFHYINVVPFIDVILSMMKPFMKKDLIDMLQFHTNGMDSLFEHVPQEILPDELGGKAGKLLNLKEEYLVKLRQYKKWFEEDEIFRVEESKRHGKPKDSDQLFGISGSFRKLNID